MRTRSRPPTRSRTVPALLVLAAVTVITVDSSAGTSAPTDGLRAAVADVFGPVQTGMSAATRPLTAIGDYVTTVSRLQAENTALHDRNAQLQSQLDTTGIDRHQLAELAAMRSIARSSGLAEVTAQVVAVGPAQSFSRTVTIDAGTTDGVQPDMTVLNADGLVGRVLRASRGTATVLLVLDADSVVGARLSSSMELGFLAGNGDLSGDGRLTLTTLDRTASPTTGDTVVTWGSDSGRPYLPGVPIGAVESVQASLREQTTVAVVRPFVDFSALDLVSVVTGATKRGPVNQAAGGNAP